MEITESVNGTRVIGQCEIQRKIRGCGRGMGWRVLFYGKRGGCVIGQQVLENGAECYIWSLLKMYSRGSGITGSKIRREVSKIGLEGAVAQNLSVGKSVGAGREGVKTLGITGGAMAHFDIGQDKLGSSI